MRVSQQDKHEQSRLLLAFGHRKQMRRHKLVTSYRARSACELCCCVEDSLSTAQQAMSHLVAFV